MVTADDVRAIALSLPRAYEALVRDRVKYRWGRAGQPMRLQTLRFNTDADARAAYFARLADLDAKGYLDAIAE